MTYNRKPMYGQTFDRLSTLQAKRFNAAWFDGAKIAETHGHHGARWVFRRSGKFVYFAEFPFAAAEAWHVYRVPVEFITSDMDVAGRADIARQVDGDITHSEWKKESFKAEDRALAERIADALIAVCCPALKGPPCSAS